MVILAATVSGWLTAPIRNDPPRYPRLIGTKTPDFSAYSEWITKTPYLKHFLKTIENRAHDQPSGARP
jgi:hypothetical protein